MAELLKNLYTREFIELLGKSMNSVLTDFNPKRFAEEVFDREWNSRELKQRTNHISTVFGHYLSNSYSKSIKELFEILEEMGNNGIKVESLTSLFLTTYIENNGVDHFETSIPAMERLTQFISCEFAVRPFVLEYGQRMYDQMLEWTTHESEHVRRLASEGSRPMLPWGMAFPELKKDPAPIVPILEALKSDPSEYVRRSVANSLNDISKHHPNFVLTLSKRWIGTSSETDWIVKHACRSLLKQGIPEAMQLFGFGSIEEIKVDHLEVTPKALKIGEALQFSFNLHNLASSKSKLRLEYGLYYKKHNGNLSRKVFKISEKQYPPESTTRITKKQSFKIISTRKFYRGTHKVSIIVNGYELIEKEFELL